MEAFKPEEKSTASRGKSTFRGVTKLGNKWRAVISLGRGVVFRLGSFTDVEEAARAYDSAAFHLHKG